MSDASYAEAVKESFLTKPLRTVLMIDDAFPTFADMCGPEIEVKYPQKDRALALYRGFRSLQMLCDIANEVNDVDADHFRKGDMIVLDYHLIPGSEDNERAIKLLRSLSSSKHFNSVVVYTAEKDQNKVWLDVIASLSGGWSAITATLDGEAKEHWERLSDEEKLPTPPLEAVMQFARNGDVRRIAENVRKITQDELVQLGVPASACSKIIEYLIAKELSIRAGGYASEPSRHGVGDYSNGNRWIQIGNTFVVIMEKLEGGSQDETDAIMTSLREALLAWRPNIIQLVVSEIQNHLELEGLATNEALLREPSTQTALTFYLLENLGKLDPSAEPDVRVPMMGLVDRIVDSMRRKLSSDDQLLSLAEKALLGELRETGWTADNWPTPGRTEMFKAAVQVSRTNAKSADVFFRLNHFLSTERFRRAHLTTGTIFHHAAKDQYFVTVSPACDLVARKPSDAQVWALSLHPLTPVVAVLLQPLKEINSALAVATQGEHIFLEIKGERRVFKVVNGVGHQLSYEFFFVKNEGRVQDQDGKKVFEAARLAPVPPAPAAEGSSDAPFENPAAENEPAALKKEVAAERADADRQLIYDQFEIVEQLRGVNATQLLQLAGQHLSRVGLDYVNMPSS